MSFIVPVMLVAGSVVTAPLSSSAVQVTNSPVLFMVTLLTLSVPEHWYETMRLVMLDIGSCVVYVSPVMFEDGNVDV